MEDQKISYKNFQCEGKEEIQNLNKKANSDCKRAKKNINQSLQSKLTNMHLDVENASRIQRYQELQLERKGLEPKLLQKQVILDERLTDAMEVFLNQKFVEAKQISKGETTQYSKAIKHVLQILNLNKKLFMKMLEDPNSYLARHIDDLRKAQKAKTCQTHGHLIRKYEESIKNNRVAYKNNRYFRERYRKETVNLSKGGGIPYCFPHNTSILKQEAKNKEAQISFMDVKMKLRRMIGGRPDISDSSSSLAINGHDSQQSRGVSTLPTMEQKDMQLKGHKFRQREIPTFKEARIHPNTMLYRGDTKEELKIDQESKNSTRTAHSKGSYIVFPIQDQEGNKKAAFVYDSPYLYTEFYPNNLNLLCEINEPKKNCNSRKNMNDFEVECVAGSAEGEASNYVLANIQGNTSFY